MSDEKDGRHGQPRTPAKNPKGNPGKDPGKNSRQDRLKLALRENLKRRKSQARGRSDAGVAPSNAEDVSPHDADGKPGE
jgi:hypothetical protein